MAGTGSATNISGADSLPEADYSIPHRSPPPIPRSPSPRIQPWVASPLSSPSTLPPEHLPPRKSPASLRRKAQAQAQEDSVSVSASEHKRRGSFGVGSFLRRTASGKHWKESEGVEEVPPLPNYKTRIAQVEAEGRSSTNSNRKISGEGRSMFRSTSKAQKELERQTREAERNAQMNRPPPQLNPLPDTGTFGNDGDPRPDSVAIFNNQYHTHSGNTPPVPNYRANNNFSRPGNNMPPSSSPAYAVRGGSGYGSSPNMTGATTGKVNGSKEYVVERSESMTNRGRYSYASSMAPVNVSSPRRVRRRKDPTPFNVLVVGAKNSGKSSLISFLRHSLALPSTKQSPNSPPETSTYNASKSSFTSHYLETEMDGERMGLTLWDSAGLEKNIVDLQLREMATFVESKFEETFVEEQKVMRSPGVKDTHIHCVFLILDPVRLDANIQAAQKGNDAGLDRLGGLDNELDLQVLRVLWGKTTVIPIVSKADTLTIGHMSFLKRAVWESMKGAKLDPLEALELEDDMAEEDEEDEDEDEDASDAYSDAHSNNEVIDNLADDSSDSNALPSSKPKTSKAKTTTHNRNSSLSVAAATADDETPYIPMSILSPDPYDLPPYTSKPAKTAGNGKEQVGRRFPWGFADPYNDQHCDFTRLRDSIFSEWRQELRDLSRSKWYENWRTSRLKNVPGSTRRVRGGVTPVASVPREGRSSPQEVRVGSGNTVPRSVSGGVTNGNVVPAEWRPSQGGAGLGAVREAAV